MPAANDVREWAHSLFRAIDARDAKRFVEFVADDGSFRYANFPPAVGKPAVEAAVAGFFGSIAAIGHRIDDVWSVPGHIVCRGTVTYTRLDGREVSMPFCNVLALAGERVTEYRVYVDPAPLTAP